ncbi:unnamed protein product [Aureobasidium vineae]|uniref:Ubiquitin fusion degradation protein n=1 Tax=Aureobasidium vineae TaxID=2773715 RepID=A0A9N8JBZ5_9PEZI|nr:unnamed protein product [Aureobasidium vineae]
MDAEALVESQPVTLVDLLNNTLIWRETAPYLPAGSVLALSATARAFRHTICESPETFRHLNLTLVKSATLLDSSPIDSGADTSQGESWRAERMDESLTEDEFFSGPLRGVFSKLNHQQLLQNVKTLILDGLSVPAELVREIVLEDRFNVKILSIRDVTNMNQRGLQSVLRYIVRPSASRLPKLKGLYLFGRKDAPETLSRRAQTAPSSHVSTGVMSSEGAQIGAAWNSRSEVALSASLNHNQPLDDWWKTKGNVWDIEGSTKHTPSPDWADILLACQGIIAFDAVLCRGPRHDPSRTTPDRLLRPAIANIALGSRGCESCGSCPEQPAVFDRDADSKFPLLAPPPLHASSVRSAQRPIVQDADVPPLILRCLECLRERWCERCNKWWCEDCYQEPISRAKRQHPNSPENSLQDNGGWALEALSANAAVKVYSNLCVETCLVGEMLPVADGMWG